MNKLSSFLVKWRYVFLLVFLVLSGISVFLMSKVNINSDMTKYLPDSSQMNQGIHTMDSEFGSATSQSTFKVMFDDLADEQKLEINDFLASIEYVSSVSYEAESTSYNKDNHTLYILSVASSKNLSKVNDIIEQQYPDLKHTVFYYDEAGALPPLIVIVLLIVVLMIMLVMCGSYLEPFLFLITIGIAILLNVGTNAFLSSVSATTNGIASILQLVLSMDYSIILSNRYRQACKKDDDHLKAMTKAIKESIISVSSSALTTIVGLLSLLFMSNKIGADLGIVLAKGVLFSLLCVFTVLPAFMLLFDKLIDKTTKNPLTIPMKGLAKFSFKNRIIVSVVFIVVAIISFVGKLYAGIQYDIAEESDIAKIFPQESTIVVLYENNDEDKMPAFLSEVEKIDGVLSVQAYANTLGKAYTAKELSGVVGSTGIDESILKTLIYTKMGDRSLESLTLEEFMTYISNLLSTDPMFADQIDDVTKAQFMQYAALLNKTTLTTPMDSASLADILSMDPDMVSLLMAQAQMKTCSIVDFLKLLKSPEVQAMMVAQGDSAQEAAASLMDFESMDTIFTMVVSEQKLDAASMFGLMENLTEDITYEYIDLLYALYYANVAYDDSWAITIHDMFDILVNSKTFGALLTDEQTGLLNAASAEIEAGKSQLVSTNYSRAIITANKTIGSEDMMECVGNIEETGKKTGLSAYYIGNSVMAYEMDNSFGKELNKITIITALAIFIVIAVSFRSLVIPAILVIVIQSAVHVTMSIMGLVHYDMFYLALLIMQCILMGATVDYAIVYTNYYREKRETSDIKEALARACQSSIRTILTSGLIMVFATAILGFTYHDNTIGPIVRIISAGVISAMVLIIIFLPSLLAVSDRFVVSKKKQ